MSTLTFNIPTNARGNPNVNPQDWVNGYMSSRPNQHAYQTLRDLNLFSEGIHERLGEIYPQRYVRNENASVSFFENPLIAIAIFIKRIFNKIYNTFLYYYYYYEISFLETAYQITTGISNDFQWIERQAAQEEEEYLETSGGAPAAAISANAEAEQNGSEAYSESSFSYSESSALAFQLSPFNRYWNFSINGIRRNTPTEAQRNCINYIMTSSLDTGILIFLLDKVLLPGLEAFNENNGRFTLQYNQKIDRQILSVGAGPWEEVPILSWIVRETRVEGSISDNGIENFTGLSFEERDTSNSYSTWIFGRPQPNVKRIQAFFNNEDQNQIQLEHSGAQRISDCSYVQFRDLLYRTNLTDQ